MIAFSTFLVISIPHPSDDAWFDEVGDAGFEDKQLHLLCTALRDESGTTGETTWSTNDFTRFQECLQVQICKMNHNMMFSAGYIYLLDSSCES